jgi:hypothetical protein
MNLNICRLHGITREEFLHVVLKNMKNLTPINEDNIPFFLGGIFVNVRYLPNTLGYFV